MQHFSGTSYLGLDQHPSYLSWVKEGLDRYGTHYGGSRLSPQSPTLFAEVEAAFAKWTGAPAALLVSSGTTAGQLAVRFLNQHYSSIHFGPFAHPSSWWPAGVQYEDWDRWLNALQYERAIGCTDAINPVAVAAPPWAKIWQETPSALMIDDSHLLGCSGPKAGGSWSLLRQKFQGELLINASLGKALALPAGLLLGEKSAIQAIRKLPQFGGASPPAPAFLYAWLQARELIQQQYARLDQHLSKMYPLVQQAPDLLEMVAGFPVIRLHQHNWVEQLAAEGIVVSSFRYPQPDSERFSRIVLRADHSDEEVENLYVTLERLIAQTLNA
ncbi:MAG: aminotransferase class I/II-fold pyridoxal phosphate-dependent enzyme [Bacteroidota bacterium]